MSGAAMVSNSRSARVYRHANALVAAPISARLVGGEMDAKSAAKDAERTEAYAYDAIDFALDAIEEARWMHR
jgi:hypothetical protein